MPPIQFTQEQARALTGISTESMRHWRNRVTYLAAKSGKSARFSFADVLGLAVMRELVSTFGVQIASIGHGLNALFRVLSDAHPASLEGTIVMITTSDASLIGVGDLMRRRLVDPVLAVPLDPLIGRIRLQMMPIFPAVEQTMLPFPPRVIRSRT